MAIDSIQDMARPPLQLNWRGLLAERGYQVAVLLFCLLHLALLLYGTSHPSAFLVADRGEKRLAKIEALANTLHNGDSLGKLFVATGSPGDYLFHALFYLWAGQPGVVVAQLLAGLVGMTYLYLLAHRLTGSSQAATMATILYILLPASVQYPHVLLTEGFFNPLVIASIYYLVSYLQDEDHLVGHLVASGFLLSVATLLREVILPIAGLVMLVLLILALRGRIRWGQLVAYAAASLLLPLALMSFFYLEIGSLSMGESDHSVGFNLAGRIARISHIEKIDPQTILGDERTVSVSQFVAFVRDHPTPFVKTLVTDLLNVIVNPGSNHLLSRYLHLYEVPAQSDYFTRARDRGLLNFAVTILTYSPLLALSNVVSLVFWLLFLVAATWGLYLLVRNSAIHWSVRLLLVVLILHFLAATQVAVDVSYRHRTPVEFILVIAASMTIMAVVERRARRHPASMTAAY